MPTELTTPVGRIVWGNPMKPQPKTHQDGAMKGQPVIKDGQPVQQWAFGVAFDKATFMRDIWPAIAAEIATGYPNGTPGRFAYKFKDGDTNDGNGIPYSNREGYAGCFVLTISTEYQAPGLFKYNGATYDQLPPEAIKTGDFVSVGLNLKVYVATGTNTPSIYVNPTAIEFVAYGTEIKSAAAADPNAVFGGQARQLPPGASLTPIGAPPGAPGMPGATAQPAPGGMPGMPAAPAPGGMPMSAPAPMAPPPPPPAPVAPAMTRPTDPSWIAPNPAGGEFWFNGTAWVPAPVLPPPAPDFVQNAGMPAPPAGMPGMPGAAAPGGMPGMPGAMPPR